MKDSKLGEYLNALLQEDWKPLRSYLKAYVREGSDLSKLIKHVYKFNKSIEQPQLDTDYIHKKLYPSKSKKAVLNLYSDLLNLIKNYLIHDELKSDEGFQKVLLLKAYHKRLLYNQADKLYRKTSEELKKEKIDFWPALYQQLMDHHYYISNNPKTAKKKLHLTLQSAINHTEIYHDQVRSLYKHETGNRLLANKVDFKTVKDDFTFRNRFENPIINIFEKLTILDQHESSDVAANLLSDFKEDHHKFTEIIRIVLYLRLKKYYAKKSNEGDLSAAKIVFSLHKVMGDNNYFQNDGQLDAIGFINIIALSSFLKEHEWTESFVQKYGNQLAAPIRRNVLSLSSAYLHYSREGYNSSLDIINQTYFKNVNLKCIAGRLQLINYIDLEEENEHFLKQKAENYRLWIYRNQNNLSKRVVISTFNLIKILNLIIENKDVQIIKDRMSKMTSIFYRYYLNKKLSKVAQE